MTTGGTVGQGLCPCRSWIGIKLVVKKPDAEIAETLEKAGFTRVMLDYVMYRN